MATLNELASSLAQMAGHENEAPFILQMKMSIGIWRSRLLRDSLERNKPDRVFFRQYLEVPLERVNISELPGFPNKPVLRTKCKLPDPVRANNIPFDFVGSPDKLSVFHLFLEQHEILASLGSRYTGDKPKALWLNKYIYVFNLDDLPFLGVASVFDDPRLINTESCGCTEETCFDDDSEYPVSGDIQQRIIQSILSVELRQPTEPVTNEVKVDEKGKA